MHRRSIAQPITRALLLYLTAADSRPASNISSRVTARRPRRSDAIAVFPHLRQPAAVRRHCRPVRHRTPRCRASCVLILGEIEFGAHMLADQIFLHLAADRERETLHEAHVAGHLVVRNSLAAELADFFLGGGRAIAQTDARTDGLTVLGVRHPDDRDIEYRRMAVEEFLDLPRRDIFAAADDHVLHSADDVAIALLVDDPEVPRAHPAAPVDRLPRALGIAPVAAHHAVAAGQQFTGGAARRDPPLRVD